MKLKMIVEGAIFILFSVLILLVLRGFGCDSDTDATILLITVPAGVYLIFAGFLYRNKNH